MSKEVMRQALEALEDLIPLCDPGFSICYDVNKAITALREALAEQPAQQEPVAWIVEDQSGERLEWASDAHSCHGVPTFPLYTSPQPAQRTWVGLSDAQNTVIWANSQSVDEAIRATEKQLMENNI